jgi:hypothetical protein
LIKLPLPTRRLFLTSLTSAPLTAALADKCFAWGADAGGRPLILGVPLTHPDWMLRPGIEWGEAGVRHMLDACKASGWSRVYWRALDGGRALYKSTLVRAQGKWDLDNGLNPQSEADKALLLSFGQEPVKAIETLKKVETLDYASFDSMAAAVEYGHKIGLEIHAWISINEDDHGWGVTSDFAKQNPKLRWVRRDGRPYRSQLSFAFREVQEYKLGILRELIENYPLDGVFFDWIRTGDVRDNPQNDSEGVADYGYDAVNVDAFRKRFGEAPRDVENGDPRWVQLRAEPQTVFARSAAKLIRSQKRKLPISAMVAHPWHYRGAGDKIDGNLRGLLLDVSTWAREGLIDSVVGAGYYRDGGTAEKAYEALRKETGGKTDVWAYGWVPETVAGFEADVSLAAKVGANQLLLWEADYIDARPNANELKAAMAACAASPAGR